MNQCSVFFFFSFHVLRTLFTDLITLFEKKALFKKLHKSHFTAFKAVKLRSNV